MDLTTDPNSALWKDAPAVFGDHSSKGTPELDYKLEVRSRWTPDNLYFLFICPYKDALFLKPEVDLEHETNKLWEWDVAEVFVGGDFEKIWQYREYQVSPRGEWVDLDIDRKEPKPEGGWLWNSGYKVAAHIDPAKHIWYGAMRIPVRSVVTTPAKLGQEFRVNFYSIQGPKPDSARHFVAWQQTGSHHHIPEKFGLLRLVD